MTLALLFALYGALGVAQAAQNAMNVAWAVPRNKRPNPVLVRLRSLLLLATAGLALLAATVVTTLAAGGAFGDGHRAHGAVLRAVRAAQHRRPRCSRCGSATALELSNRDVLPGALLGGIVWQLLQVFGAVYVDSVVKGASDTNGTFAFVFGLLAWIYLLAVSLVLCVEINVVRARRLWPRSLLTPFTDDVDLTAADQRAYTAVRPRPAQQGVRDGRRARSSTTASTPPPRRRDR